MSSKSKSVLVTAKGFLVDIQFNIETKSFNYIYTTVLREAMFASSKSLTTKKEKHNIEGFIYSPFKEEPFRDKYEVYDLSKSYSYGYGQKFGFGIHKVCMSNLSDVKFLSEFSSQEKSWDKFYSLEEAKEIAKQKNQELISKTQEVLSSLY